MWFQPIPPSMNWPESMKRLHQTTHHNSTTAKWTITKFWRRGWFEAWANGLSKFAIKGQITSSLPHSWKEMASNNSLRASTIALFEWRKRGLQFIGIASAFNPKSLPWIYVLVFDWPSGLLQAGRIQAVHKTERLPHASVALALALASPSVASSLPDRPAQKSCALHVR